MEYEVSPEFLPRNLSGRPLAFILMVWIPAALSGLVTTLRLYARMSRSAASWDDLLMSMSMVSYICSAIFATMMWKYGFGQHVLMLSYDDITEIAKWTIASQISITLGPAFAKLSTCVFILRMIHTTQRRLSIFLYALMGVLLLIAVATTLTWCFQCIPLKKFWNPLSEGTCVDRMIFVRMFQGYNVVGVVTDFACAITPIFILKSLQISQRRKTELRILMGLAMFPGICCIFKTIDTIHYDDADFSWRMVPGVYWIILELSSGIILSSLPTLHGLTSKVATRFSSLFSKLSSTFAASHRSNSNPSTKNSQNSQKRFLSTPGASSAGWSQETSLACPAECAFCRAHHVGRGAGLPASPLNPIPQMAVRAAAPGPAPTEKPLPQRPLSEQEQRDVEITRKTSVTVFNEAGLDVEKAAGSRGGGGEKDAELLKDFQKFGLL